MQPIRTSISLHPVEDADLIAEADKLQKNKEFSNVVRSALRQYLFSDSNINMLSRLEAMSKEVKTIAKQMDEVIRLLHSGKVALTNSSSQDDQQDHEGDTSALQALSELF